MWQMNDFSILLKRVHLSRRVFTATVILLVILCILFTFSYIGIRKKIDTITMNQLRSTQLLISNINYKNERQRVILFSRDVILRTNSKLSYDEAFSIAASNVKWCEIYPNLDPILWLSLQLVESHFYRKAISPMGAIGLNQIMPFNARNLCKGFGINYKDSMLYDIELNNRFGAQLFDDAYTEYKGDISTALACYNGGPWSAFYVQQKMSTKVNDETKKYVSDVLNMLKALKEEFNAYSLDVNDIIKEK